MNFSKDFISVFGTIIEFFIPWSKLFLKKSFSLRKNRKNFYLYRWGM